MIVFSHTTAPSFCFIPSEQDDSFQIYNYTGGEAAKTGTSLQREIDQALKTGDIPSAVDGLQFADGSNESSQPREERGGYLESEYQFSIDEDFATIDERGEGSARESSAYDRESPDASDNEDATSNKEAFSDVSKEFEKLLKENAELLGTKNALNIVKDDLIARIDELTGEQCLLREEVAQLSATKQRLQQRAAELEEEQRKNRAQLDQLKRRKQDEEDEIPIAQRKRFTRAEMARVLNERNTYKERLMELEEAVRFAELARVSKETTEVAGRNKRGGIWNLFGSLWSDPAIEPALTDI